MTKTLVQAVTHPVVIIAFTAVLIGVFPSETLSVLRFILEGWSNVQG